MSLTKKEQLTIEAYEKAPKSWSDYFNSGGGWPNELKVFKKLLPKGRVLEIGAGSGRDAKELLKLGYDYVGTEISEKFIDLAKKNSPKAKFIKMSLYDLSFPYKFDGFWASAVLLHVPKNRIDEALSSLASNLKNNAVGFISVKDGEGEVLLQREMDGHKSNRFFALWSKDEFEKVLKRNGFTVLYYDYRIVTTDTNWHMFIVKINKNKQPA